MATSVTKAGKATKKAVEGFSVLQVAESLIGSQRKKKTRKGPLLVVAVATGAGIYFFDPQQGSRRRSMVRDRGMALVRRGKREAARKGDYVAGHAKGVAHEARDKATSDAPRGELTDQDLARKVESIIFREADAPKGTVDVDAAGGTVWLRGEVPSEEVKERLVSETSAIPEVAKVEDLLHLPGVPAPTRADAPAAIRRDTSRSDAPQPPESPDEVTGEQKGHPSAEPTPAESAATGTGRHAAPLGSEDDGSSS
jgi:BON domain